ncbi:uncharacterized protein MONOS_4395 [Monocercomonoides exilis]|uniref:uncharacterized protein n=1 Tax=Monocercomonoides exilis TaxID=2049356 RepID=UPI00355A3380|nr:hypothetical protein MONOS_4395 [Monocercomonoides exilis]|eukprot:MONOS_4395.1-p1 / transcript=MONOS_4395.1 / gene=MONOS_4395 / organism=Monocercomonoides_exilis_PA203 / gene_product=unspecified product / transcript_product=unspecified product / location=Mono_scaffold00116:116396-117224(-) / protein_length=169 / sequence_SO=supercontig / SO=protein_coding / is_pseudo=false
MDINLFCKWRREEEKAVWDKQLVCSSSSYSSSALAIDSSYASVVEALYTLEASMDDIQRRLRIVVSDTTVVFAQNMQLLLQTLRGYAVARRGVLYGGVVCANDVMLSAMLSVPLVVPLHSLAASMRKKSGSKLIFAASDVNAFPSINDLFDPSLLPSEIARLVSRSPQ